ncbi:MAG TPA: hypothetical protein VE076_11825 [Nitrososphaeraceae archaeon]|nr:hypothetical protein [Nitrososphaeraceae archaeon]
MRNYMKNTTTTALAVAVVIIIILTAATLVGGGGILTIIPSSAAFDMQKGRGAGSNGNTVTGQQKSQRQLFCSSAINNCVHEGLTAIGARSPPTPTPPPAPAALHVTQRIGLSKTVTPGQVGIVAVTCNPGEIATGGGYTSSQNIVVASSLAGNSNTGWLVNAFNNSTQNGILAAIAECASLVP